jgi:hypothetical protein
MTTKQQILWHKADSYLTDKKIAFAFMQNDIQKYGELRCNYGVMIEMMELRREELIKELEESLDKTNEEEQL